MPLAGDSEGLAAESVREREKPERAGTRLSEERRRDAERLGETADWLGAPPLRAAIATLLDGDAGEHAVRAARRAVRDRARSPTGWSAPVGTSPAAALAGRDRRTTPSRRRIGIGSEALAVSQTLPKKSASTDQVMRSGLYAYSSSSLGTSGGGSADSNEDSDDKSAGRGSVRERPRPRRTPRPRPTPSGSGVSPQRGVTRGSWGGSSGRVSADSAGAAHMAFVPALAALSCLARARAGLAAIRARPAATRRPRLRPTPGAGARGRRLGLRGCVRGETRVGGRGTIDRRAPRGAFRRRFFLFFFFFVASSRSMIAPTRRLSPPASRSSAPSRRASSVSHAPRLMDAVGGAANASSRRRRASRPPAFGAKTSGTAPADRSSYDRSYDRSETDDLNDLNARVHGNTRESGWRARSEKLLRALERRADEYAKK